jgi:Ca-activated chloride channel family protein
MRSHPLLGWSLLVFGCAGGAGAGSETLAEVVAVRPPVRVGGDAIVDARRVADGDRVVVAEGGRAWLVHDRATRLLLDGGAAVTVSAAGARLDAGRVWVEAAEGVPAEGGRAEITTPFAVLVASGAGAGFEAVLGGETLRLTVARGELTYRAGDRRGQVRAGETARIDGRGADVRPEPLWDDWTGGLGWPDPGHGGGARTLGEIGARAPGSLGEARFPLAITRLEVRARIAGDLAQTRVIQTFFNPASIAVEGLYRVRMPEGALLARFAIDRDGRWADGYVKERQAARTQYQQQVYAGSTKDPALLEWEAPGSYRARIYPIPPGATRRVLVEYSEWLTPRGDRGRERAWRFPMAGGAGGPVIQELDVVVDAEDAGADSLRAGLGARIEDEQVILERTDFQPRSDLVVDLVGAPRDPGKARAYRAAHRARKGGARGPGGGREDDYYLALPIPLPLAPTDRRSPLDLVVVADVSAGTDAAHLSLGRTLVEAVLRHLGAEDRVAVLGADLGLHPLAPAPARAAAGTPAPSGPASKPGLLPATRPNLDRMLDALARAGTGGATDLGATLTQAAALLGAGGSGRRGAVIYVGDAFPTVGEIDVKALRERIDRLPAPLRLYGVAVGDDADLALLEGLSAGGGFAARVRDRAEAAGAALRLVGHASRRAAFRVEVDLGGGLEQIFPRRPTAVVEGEALPILARVRSGVPSQVSITGILDGAPFTVRRRLLTANVSGTADLRLRWSAARLAQLLADGASAEEVAELGTRQNLITPFTSYYVPSADELSVAEHEVAEEERPQFLARNSADRLKGESGKMGKRTTPAAEGLHALRSPAEPPPASPAAAPAAPDMPPPIASRRPPRGEEQAKNAGILGTLKQSEGARIASVFGRDEALAADSAQVLGDLIGADAEKAYGVGGLGVTGTGSGGGGTGEGTISLGTLGTIGKGGGGSYAKSSGSRRAKPPEVIPGAANIRGSLDKGIVHRIIRRHINEVKYCHEQELAKKPDLGGRIQVQFTIAASGQVIASVLQSSTLGNSRVENCVVQAVRRWEFPKPLGGGIVIISYPFVFVPGGSGGGRSAAPAPPLGELYAAADDQTVIRIHIGISAHRPKHCSPASRLDAADRAALWRERLAKHAGVDGAMEVWQDATASCELGSWSDRRRLLRGMLASVRLGGAARMVELYRRFGGSPAEQDFLRRAVIGEVRTAADLRVIYDGIGMSEEVKGTLVDEVLAKARTEEDRAVGLLRLIDRWPEDVRLKLKLIEALEASKRPADARRIADDVRASPYSDAEARTRVGEFLVRQGDEPAARRAFSEIVEFAPRDPLARRRLGDLYRAHGWFDEAYRQYQTLAVLSPGDPAVLLLEAAAAAGAGRTDEALRLEQRVAESTEPGAEAGIARVALWWSTVRQAELRQAARRKGDAAELARLQGRARRTGVLRDARPFRAFLTWAHPEADCELSAALPGAPLAPATEIAPEFGLAGVSSREPIRAPVLLAVQRAATGSPLRYRARLIVIWDEGAKTERLEEVPLAFGPGVSGYRLSVSDRAVEVLR